MRERKRREAEVIQELTAVGSTSTQFVSKQKQAEQSENGDSAAR
jgi:hypothetical protein